MQYWASPESGILNIILSVCCKYCYIFKYCLVCKNNSIDKPEYINYISIVRNMMI